jgi:glycosyltransferase involved in cell wall biosynthesis
MAKRLLVVNVHFSPQSFGGATVVADQLSKRLARDHGWTVSAFTSLRSANVPDYAIRRYRSIGVDVVAVNIPQVSEYQESYFNPRVADRFRDVLDAIQPDIVHVHCVQLLGCDLFDALDERGIPFAVTLHDCWWLCERQFMIDGSGRYCFQTTISPDRCRYCVDDFQANRKRMPYVQGQLAKADMLLFPSEFQRELYAANGFAGNRSLVNKNGVMPPKDGYQRKAGNPSRTTLGFIGGPGPIKGADLVVRALNELGRSDYELRIVDAARYLGASWTDKRYWDVPGDVTFLPPYNADSMDDFFSSIDVLLFPSQWKESFGLTVREALLRDVWVIATDAGGLSEDLRPGINADVIAMNGHHEELRHALERCLDHNGWGDYRNPCKEDIVTLDEQAGELDGLLRRLSDSD